VKYRMTQKVSVYSNNAHTIDNLKMAITEYIRNVDRAVLNTVFENTVRRVWRLAGDILNITCNFLCCNHQVHRDVLITLYNSYCSTLLKCVVSAITFITLSRVFAKCDILP
jgi:hypothetical protein